MRCWVEKFINRMLLLTIATQAIFSKLSEGARSQVLLDFLRKVEAGDTEEGYWPTSADRDLIEEMVPMWLSSSSLAPGSRILQLNAGGETQSTCQLLDRPSRLEDVVAQLHR